MLRISLALATVVFAAACGPTEHASIKAPAKLDANGPAQPTPVVVADLADASVCRGFVIAGQPSEKALREFKERGIKTVVNFRHAAEIENFAEASLLEQLDIDYVHLPFNTPAELSADIYAQARDLFRTVRRPALFHCATGNRIAPLWIAWRVLDEGAEFELAVAEAREMGLRSEAYVDSARAYIAAQSKSD